MIVIVNLKHCNVVGVFERINQALQKNDLDKLKAEYNELKAEHNETFTFVCASTDCASVIEGKIQGLLQ